jgi:N-acetylneuraminate lyase
MNPPYSGIIVAPTTPFTAEGKLNTTIIGEQARAYANNGIIGAFIAGTTGEGFSLSTQERLQLAEKWRSSLPEEFALLVHVGHHSIQEAKRLAEHAETEITADAIAAVGPGYHKPQTVQDLVDFCSEIADNAPDTPFYYYHIPGVSGVQFQMRDVIEMMAEEIPTFIGMKYSHDDLLDFGLCLDYQKGKYNLLFGRDENMLAGLATGAAGFIGSTYNIAAPLYHGIIEAYQSGDIEKAQKKQGQSRLLIRTLEKYNFMPALKATMGLIGIDCGPLRLPQRTLPEDQVQALYADLHRINFFSYALQL